MNQINSQAVNIDKISTLNQDIKSKILRQKGDGAFNEILTGKIDKTGNNTALGNKKELQEIDGTFNAQKINLELDTTQFTQKLDSALNMLELYAQILQDPDKTLKQAWSILEQLTANTQALDEEFKNNTLFNNDLKSVLTNILTTVEVENIKFNRGDYT